MQPAIACSPRFPLEAYIVTLVGVDTVSRPAIAGRDVISLNVSSPGLQPNENYFVFVSACISVTCRPSVPPIPFSKL